MDVKKVIELLSSIDIEVFEDDIKDIESVDELCEYLDENNHFDIEIIYYANAMEYLSEHDNSLRESLELASDAGYELKNLSSETLASLLASKNMREAFEGLRDELDSALEN